MNDTILIIFVLTYAGIAAGKIPGLALNRTGMALLGAIAMLTFGRVSTAQAISYVNWPTLFLLFGFFVISAQLRLCGFYHRIAELIASRLDRPATFLFLLMVVTAALSACLNNDVVCLVFTPIVATALLQRRLDPVPFLIAIAVASNLGAAYTLIGNAQNMMVGEVAHLSFGRYLIWCFVPVTFALGCAYALIWQLSKNHILAASGAQIVPPDADYEYNHAHVVKGLVVLSAVVVLFFFPVPREIVALTAAGIHLASPKFKTDSILELVTWPVLVFFFGLFVVTGAFESTGCGEAAISWLSNIHVTVQEPHTLALTTAVLSNLTSNSAAVMLLLKVVNLSQASTAYVVALANSFGGNLFIIGSVANILVVQQAQQSGVQITFRAFARIGLPVTIAALAGLLAWISLLT